MVLLHGDLRCLRKVQGAQEGLRLNGAHNNKNVYYMLLLIPVVARSKALFCGCSPAGIAGSNPARGHGCLS